MTEHEELAARLDDDGRHLIETAYARHCQRTLQLGVRVIRAAALLREAHPRPVNGWLSMDSAPKDGTEILTSNYFSIEITRWERGIGWINRNEEEVFASLWRPAPVLPRPPRCGERK